VAEQAIEARVAPFRRMPGSPLQREHRAELMTTQALSANFAAHPLMRKVSRHCGRAVEARKRLRTANDEDNYGDERQVTNFHFCDLRNR
jgi:hypothetical protein